MLDKGGETFRYLYDAAHWRGRAEQMRLLANVMRDQRASRMMFETAAGFDWLADWAEHYLLDSETTMRIEQTAISKEFLDRIFVTQKSR